MGSVTRHFGPGPNGTIRFQTRYEDSDSGMVGHSDRLVETQADIFGIPCADFVAAGYGSIEEFEDRPPAIPRVDDQPKGTEAGP